MKLTKNFRLQPKIISILDDLSESMNTTQTNIIELAIKKFYRASYPPKNKLFEFKGKLSSKDADEFLKIIRKSRINKKIQSL